MRQKEPLVEIVLPTFNGDSYIRQQIQSILEQTYPNIFLILMDDGSVDSSLEIIQQYLLDYPEKIRNVAPDKKRKGATQAFSALLENTTADYVFLADQDDVWKNIKIRVQMDKMLECEEEWGSETPILIHSDMEVVDQDLNQIHPSMLEFIGRNPQKRTMNHLLTTNYINGNSMLLNRALLQIAVPVPEKALYHDWWLGLVASAVGKIGFIREPLVLYRQHTCNDVGAQKRAILSEPISFIRKIKFHMGNPDRLPVNIDQAEALKNYAYAQMTPEKQKLLDAFIRLKDRSFLMKRLDIFRFGFLKHRPLQIFSQLFRIS